MLCNQFLTHMQPGFDSHAESESAPLMNVNVDGVCATQMDLLEAQQGFESFMSDYDYSNSIHDLNNNTDNVITGKCTCPFFGLENHVSMYHQLFICLAMRLSVTKTEMMSFS